MSPFAIAWRYLCTRRMHTCLSAFVIALGVGLAIAVVVLSGGIRRGLTTAGGPFELVIGPKGSATQLVVSSVLLQDAPIGNITYAQYEAIRADTRVKDAVPIALGDNAQGIALIGTTPDLFSIQVAPDRPPFYQFADGRPFTGEFEAVLGSTAAARLELTVGTTFVSSHGTMPSLNDTNHADSPYRVVGVLNKTNTPADLGIYVPLSSYWRVHGETSSSIFTLGSSEENSSHTSTPQELQGITAVLVRARDISSAYQLYQQVNAGNELQAALPGVVLTQFLSLLGQGQQLLLPVTYIGLIMAAISTALALYGAVLARRRSTAVLRALGASRSVVFQIALWESVLLGILGLAGGLVLGHGTAAVVAAVINQQRALAVAVGFEIAEIPIVLGMFALGILAGLAPAVQLYRLQAGAVLSESS